MRRPNSAAPTDNPAALHGENISESKRRPDGSDAEAYAPVESSSFLQRPPFGERLNRGVTAFRAMTRAAPVALLDQMAVSGFGFLSGVLAARLLGTSEFGVFALVIILTAFAHGIQHTLVAAPMMTLAGGRGTSSGSYEASVLVTSILLSLALAAVTSLVLAGIFAFRHDAAARFEIALATAAFAWVQNVQFTVRKIMFARGDGRQSLLMDLVRPVVLLTLLAGGAIAGTPPSTSLFVWALTACTLATTWPFAISIWKRRRLGVHPSLVMQRHWRVAKWLLPIVFVTFGQEQLVWILAGVALGDEALGGLRAAQYLVGAVAVVLASTENVLPLAASRAHARGGRPDVYAYLESISWALAPVIGIMLAVISYGSADLLALIFGAPFAAYAACVEILCVGLLFVFIRDVATVYFRVIQETATVFQGFLASFVVTALLFYPLLIEFGAAGVAATITIGHFTSMLFIVYHAFIGRAQIQAKAARNGAA